MQTHRLLVTCNMSCAPRYKGTALRKHIDCLSRATCHVPHGTKGQLCANTSIACHMQHVMCHMVQRDSSATKSGRVEIAFILALLFSLAETINLWRKDQKKNKNYFKRKTKDLHFH